MHFVHRKSTSNNAHNYGHVPTDCETSNKVNKLPFHLEGGEECGKMCSGEKRSHDLTSSQKVKVMAKANNHETKTHLSPKAKQCCLNKWCKTQVSNILNLIYLQS